MPADQWLVVEKGLFKDYQTTREQVARIRELTGVSRSHGCSFAESWNRVQFQRMPNISLLPGERDIGLDDIVAATERGIVIKNRGSWSIDHQRFNFQFSGQAFYEVRDGKIAGMLRDVAYQSNTPVFWNCDGHDRRPVVVLDGRIVQRRQGRAGAVELGQPRLRAGALQERHDSQHEAHRMTLQASSASTRRRAAVARSGQEAIADRVLSLRGAASTRRA